MKNRNRMTKFPVARIKKIMQKDEEVGKVAQATPVVICACSFPKALELFLQMIVDEASNVTTSRGSKKVEAYHLKHAIETVEMLDFLKEIVENVPDPSQGGSISIDGPADGEGAAPVKRARRGKKAVKDDDEGAEPAPKKRRRKKSVVTKEEMEEKDEEMEAEAAEERARSDYDE
ncbi:hypothetical protein FA95DRAFT_1512438 [Auriscalpium vulgare]|uniref:Uncharacterized protein n=1 Tax=Auriscalpium vulgare TaxID=40419 RepID=A0ACB8S4B1_9AGAM|nr:hypothetical protein FA95DRAFT_1512438 [Auriscalpium vulgare]